MRNKKETEKAALIEKRGAGAILITMHNADDYIFKFRFLLESDPAFKGFDFQSYEETTTILLRIDPEYTDEIIADLPFYMKVASNRNSARSSATEVSSPEHMAVQKISPGNIRIILPNIESISFLQLFFERDIRFLCCMLDDAVAMTATVRVNTVFEEDIIADLPSYIRLASNCSLRHARIMSSARDKDSLTTAKAPDVTTVSSAPDKQVAAAAAASAKPVATSSAALVTTSSLPIVKINTLDQLNRNSLFSALNQLQSAFDNNDPVITSNQFTRSPYHALTFLVVYAGLTDEQKTIALAKLNSETINKALLDNLVNNINWENILIRKTGTLQFEFSIGIVNKKYFLDAAERKCQPLYAALTHHNCFVKIESCDAVKFTTKISQDELWKHEFTKDMAHWTVPHFELSEQLKTKIAMLHTGQQTSFGAFHIIKGTADCELRILAPERSDEFSIHNKIEVNKGIYEVFVGLHDFYGLDVVDDVSVKLESKATFSDTGASASQTQEVEYLVECSLARSGIDERTIITINQLHVFFKGADIVANFSETREAAAGFFDQNVWIQLNTKGNKTTIFLFPQMPTPQEAFLMLEAKKQSQDVCEVIPAAATAAAASASPERPLAAASATPERPLAATGFLSQLFGFFTLHAERTDKKSRNNTTADYKKRI